MAGLLGFTLADLSGAVDSRKRQYANLVRGLLSDPGATLAQLAAVDAEAARGNRYTQMSAGSVMPEVAQQGQEAMLNAALNVGGLLGITAYHGSPHTFDKFDMSKIGTGEGAQAYGHGLYFAENPGTAQTYRNIGADETRNLERHVKAELDKPSPNMEWVAQARQRIAERKGAGIDKDVYGNMYKVDIPDEAVAKMLDWDKPLSQQPEAVRKALTDAGLKNADSKLMTGSSAYGMLASKLRPEGADNTVRDSAAAAKRLRELGIPGIKYKDGGSRGSEGGTSNFVLFDDQLPKIIGRE